jgi:hypothetical protein
MPTIHHRNGFRIYFYSHKPNERLPVHIDKADTTIMDAQTVDRLKFFGIPLTGGDAGATSLSLFLSAFSGSADIAGTVLGAVNLGGALLDIKRKGERTGRVYYDTFLPNIMYITEANAKGGIDLLVYNALSPLSDLLFGDNKAFDKTYDPVTGDEIPNPLRKTGVQRIKNFDMANSSLQGLAAAAFAADNDNQPRAWREAAFRFVQGEAA